MAAIIPHLRLVSDTPEAHMSLEDRLKAIEQAAGGLEAAATLGAHALPYATTVFHGDGTKTVTPWVPIPVLFSSPQTE